MRGRTAELDAERRAAEARADELESAMFAPEPAAEGIETGAAGPRVEKLADVSGAIDAVIAERDVAREIADELGARLDTAKARLADWRQREEELLSRIEEAARTSLAGMSELFERAELDLDSILAETRRDFTGRGGPFRPLAVAPVAGPEEEPRIAALLDDLERVQLMRLAAERLPFTAPVTGVRLTSGFGKRRDPFSKRWAMHEGLDYAGPVGTPIRAAAAGRVVHAGWMGGYGKVVTIRHAFGYETRYAHLSRIDVTRGERVAAGDRIGSMGSTGRSTGSHLHYEVRANDRPVNPAKFIEAARNVL
jgi:murein DD-endopeptidase MepM/ murein hydrolase activator NlpD